MKSTLCFFLGFLFLSASLSSQIAVEGELKLGDNSQILLLETKNGDRFLGNISKWTKDSLQFELTTKDLLDFHTSEVERMVAQEKEAVRIGDEQDLSLGTFTIYSRDGKIREGQLVSINQNGVRIKYRRNRRAYIRTSNLNRVTFEPYTDTYNYPNTYNLHLKKGKKIHGNLIQMDEEEVIFKPDGQKAFSFPRSQMTELKQRKGYRPSLGHQQALLLTPTGFNLRKGESELRNIDYIFNNSYSTGINDHLSATAGLFGIEPYFKIKASHDIGKYVHLSIGGGIALSGAAGWHVAASLGTPDHYLNLGYTENKGDMIAGETDMDALFFGGSWRIGNRQRLFGEVTHIAEKKSVFDSNGWGSNSFAVGYGWFGRRGQPELGADAGGKDSTGKLLCVYPYLCLLPLWGGNAY